LAELEQENGDGEPVHQQDKVSTTDPDATYASKGKTVARLGYYDNYLVDNASCIVVGVQATAARLSQESAAAGDMIDGYRERYGRLPQSLAADNTYGNGELLHWLVERGIPRPPYNQRLFVVRLLDHRDSATEHGRAVTLFQAALALAANVILRACLDLRVTLIGLRWSDV